MFIDAEIKRVDIKKLQDSIENIDKKIEEVQNLIDDIKPGTSIFKYYSRTEYSNLQEKIKKGSAINDLERDSIQILIDTQVIVSQLLDHDKITEHLKSVLEMLKKAKKDINRNVHAYGLLKTVTSLELQEDMKEMFRIQDEAENV